MPAKTAPPTVAMRRRIQHAARLIDPSAREAILDFLLKQRDPSGGYHNRNGTPDIYYTAFAMETRTGLGNPDTSPALEAYLNMQAQRTDLRLPERVCLVRALAHLDAAHPAIPAHLHTLETYRSRDGGYAPAPGGAERSSAYAPFLVSLAWADAGKELPERGQAAEAVLALRRADGGFANDDALQVSATPPSAAAAVFLHTHPGFDPEPTHAFLQRRTSPTGGLYAVPGAPLPDLLSTATGLHALAVGDAELTTLRETCLAFVEGLWHEDGGFRAHALDPVPDCEYTYYGLLALGHLLL